MNERDRRCLPALIAAFVLVGVAAWASVFLPVTQSPAPKQSAEPTQQVLRVWEGQLALFDGAEEPCEVYEVAVASLPPEEQMRLQEGIVIESEEMLAELLDNYTS